MSLPGAQLGSHFRAYSGRFSQRTAVITGGASGVGREVALRITAEGGHVSLWDRDEEMLREAAAAIGGAHTVRVDVADAVQVTSAAESSFAALGRIDVLVASAGITGPTAAL